VLQECDERIVENCRYCSRSLEIGDSGCADCGDWRHLLNIRTLRSDSEPQSSETKPDVTAERRQVLYVVTKDGMFSHVETNTGRKVGLGEWQDDDDGYQLAEIIQR